MPDTNCPYCNAGIEICHDDGYGYNEDEKYNQECGACGKRFVFETTLVFYYETQKADCLNDGEHSWQTTNTYPKRYAKLECEFCGEREDLPKDHPNLIGE